jgi:hypothetical protein
VLAVSAAQNLAAILDMIVVGISIIFITEPRLYINLKRGTATCSQILYALCLDNENAEWPIGNTRNVWKYVLGEHLDEEVIKGIERGLFNYSLRREAIIPMVIENIMEIYVFS